MQYDIHPTDIILHFSWVEENAPTQKTGEKNEITTEKTTEKTREKTREKTENIREKNEKTMEKTAQKIIVLIGENPMITQSELAQKCEISQKGIEWQLKQLKGKGLIRRVGPDKGGHWEIVEDK